jgi:surface antigen
MDKAFQKAMEFRKSGESVPWSMPDTAWSGKITPTGTFRLLDGRYSRRFIHKLNLPDGQRTYYGLALRNANGKWIIPRR